MAKLMLTKTHISYTFTSMIKTFQQLLTKFKVKFRLLMMDYKALGDLAQPIPSLSLSVQVPQAHEVVATLI